MKKVHFIGICGAGMSAVAKLMQDLGWQVTGSDDDFYPPVSTYLRDNNIPFSKGYHPKNIPAHPDLIVIGKHAGLTPDKNKEVEEAFKNGAVIKSFAEVLGNLTGNKENIVVAGSHGKSTCAALLAWCLERAGKDPSYFVGATGETPSQSSRLGKGEVFVLEGDEYPSSNWDSRSKFLHYHPNHVLLTSLAHDHLNIFKTAEDYRAPFKQLLNMIPLAGFVAACADGEGVLKILKELNKEAVLYSLKSPAPWHIKNMKYGKVSSFDIIRNNNAVTHISTGLLGNHNMENILGVSALLLTLNLITPQELVQAVTEFKPLARRLDRKSEKTRIPVYEGFGSSRDKALAAISAIRLHFPDRKLLVIFEPHAFSWRRREALVWYRNIFDGTSRVLIYKPPEHGAAADQLTLAEIVKAAGLAGSDAVGFETPEKGLALFEQCIDNDSVVLILSSGGFDGIIESVVGITDKKFPKL